MASAILIPMNIRKYMSAFLVLVIVALLHFSAMYTNWYLLYWWFDVLMHFLGGLWVGLSTIWLFYDSGFFSHNFSNNSRFSFEKSRHTLALITFASLLAVGLGWELFEYSLGLTYIGPWETYPMDTITDIAMDLLGAYVGLLWYWMRNKNNFNSICQ
jgi:hypothetical protein